MLTQRAVDGLARGSFGSSSPADRRPHFRSSSVFRMGSSTGDENVQIAVMIGDVTVHAYPCAQEVEIVDGAVFIHGIDCGPVPTGPDVSAQYLHR